jgi:hypothetical protein
MNKRMFRCAGVAVIVILAGGVSFACSDFR